MNDGLVNYYVAVARHGRDHGEDLVPALVQAAFWDRKCPRCGSRTGTSREQFTKKCLWLSDDVRGGFRCLKEHRDGHDARKP